MLRTLRWMLAVAALGAVGGVAPGCGDLQPPVNQVQAGALEKSVFAGEWYFQQTVIDTPYSSFTFVGNQGDMERIRWEVQENFLLGRRSYEYIANSEVGGLSGPQALQGAIVAAYRIQSHFDIRRQYNPVTGEETNVITENIFDRPWYERQFMRVDWSQNLSTGSDLFMFDRLFGGVMATPVAYSSTDPSSPDAPRFERDTSNSVHYMDITNRVFLTPEMVEIWGMRLPGCLLANFINSANLDCHEHEIGVRNSFLRVDEAARDYQPFVYDGDHMERFGYFTTERAGYNRQYGTVDGERFHFAERHNLWMQSHKRQPGVDGRPGALVSCLEDADCADGRGSLCDLDLARALRTTDSTGRYQGACTIPYRERTPRPMVYYHPGLPDVLWGDAVGFSDDWNTAFVNVVSSLREQECLATEGLPEDCINERDRPDALNMYIACRSPVALNDAEACGRRGMVINPGDLRYSQTPYVNDPHLAAPLGYGPHSADPLTGEVIMANAYVYGAGVDTIASFGRDLIRLLDGDIDIDQVADGGTVQAWLDQQRIQGAGQERTAMQHAVHIDGHNLDEVIGGMDFSNTRMGGRPEASEGPASRWDAQRLNSSNIDPRTAVADSRRRLGNAGAYGSPTSAYSRLALLRGTDIERQMVESAPEVLMAANLDPNSIGAELSPDMINAASVITGLNNDRQDALRHYLDMVNAESCLLDASFADASLLGLARAVRRAADNGEVINWYGVEYPILDEAGELDWNLVRAMLIHPIYHAVTAHEIGHTVGLRHNFMGSFDAVNYDPRYWELRNDGDMAPRLWDPISEAELNGRILENSTSSVMDYGVNFIVTDANGLGHYDHAAIKMGYGDLVEVFTNARNPQDVATWNWGQTDWLGPILPSSFQGGGTLAFRSYTDWPAVIGSVDALQERADVPYSTTVPDEFLAGFAGSSTRYRAPDGRPMVPYMFGTDDNADLGPDNMRYDQGADVYETIQSISDNYWNFYPFSHFRRQRIGFSAGGVAGRSSGRYFNKLTSANQIYALYRPIFTDIFGLAEDDSFWTREDGFGAWTGATGVAFSLLARVATAPEPGSYVSTRRPDGSTVFEPGQGSTLSPGIRVNALDGRFTETTWNFDNGFYWRDQLERVGFTYDKVSAFMALTDSTANFVGRDTDADVRRYQLSFATTFGPAITNLFRGVMGEDWTTIGPRFGPPVSGRSPDLVYPTPAELAAGGTTITAAPINPAAGFTIQLYASVFGMAYLPETYDQDFLNRARIWADGSDEAIGIPDADTVSWTDPRSSITYRARSYMVGTGATARETGVGAQMLRHQMALMANPAATLEARRFVDNIDIIRRLTAILGAGRGGLSP